MKRKKIRSSAAQADDEENRNSDIFDIENSDPSTAPPPPKLWVDKHAPTMISHLLSGERTNREVLRCIITVESNVIIC